MKQPGQTETHFWRQYAAGAFRGLAQLIEGRRQLAAAPDHVGADRFTRDPLDGEKFEAPERLKYPSIMTSEPVLRQHSRADWQHTDIRLQIWAARFIEAARKRGVPLYVHSAFRTKAEQDELVRRKVTKAPYPQSPHNLGEAVDIVHSQYHWQMTRDEWAYLSIIGRQVLFRMNQQLKAEQRLYLVWGGDWSFYDPAHWEIADFKARTRVVDVGEPIRKTPRAILSNDRLPDPKQPPSL